MGKVLPVLTTILSPYLPSAAPWEAPGAGLGGVLEVTGSCLTEAETETQAEEMT